MANIETGVDKLVQLVKDKQKISLKEASKILGVSKIVLQEWADFLQEEGVIDIDFKLTTTWLIEKKLTEEDLKNKKDDFNSLKENFVRKAETAIESINRESNGLDKIKTQFTSLKKELGDELEHVQEHVKELENFENLKKNIDHEILNQQAEFKNSMAKIHSDLIAEEKKYQNLVAVIEKEKDEVRKGERDLKLMRDREDELQSKLNDIKKFVEDIHKNIDNNNDKIKYTKDHINSLEDTANKIEKIVMEKRKAIDPLLKKSKESEDKISDVQKKLLEKVIEKKASINKAADHGKEVISSFKTFFGKRSEVDNLLLKIEQDKINLKTELNTLIKKAKMFDIVANSKSADKHVKELKKAMDDVDQKKKVFKDEINNLIKLVNT